MKSKKLFAARCAAFALLLLTAIGFLLPQQAQAAHYITAKGDSIEQLALWSGIDISLLTAANNITGDTAQELPEGMIIYIPELYGQYVTVQLGDTLYSLAKSMGSSVEAICEHNDLYDATYIRPGQQLFIPLSNGSEINDITTQRVVEALASRSSSWLWPVEGQISSRFGQRSRGYHYGLDIAADHGSAICAAQSGRVTESGWKNDAYGWTVMLEHADGTQTLYAHCSKLLVEQGQQVHSGETVAQVGSTGNSTGPHVHFEIRVDGACVDPLLYLK